MVEQKMVNLSLVAANFNNGNYLREFIESILASTILPSQIIIIDDGSTDNSRQILNEFETLPNAHFIYSEKNEGFANALNKGIAAANADYIMRADPDDLLCPLRIEKQYAFMQENPDLCGAGCNVEYFYYATGKVLNKSNFPVGIEAVKKSYMAGEHGMQHPTVIIKTEILKKFSYNQEHIPAEDYDLFARLIATGCKFSNLKDVLYKMRIHSSSVSSNLTFKTIQKTYALREEIFGTSTSKLKEKFYYYHILNYRRYLLERNFIKKALFLLFSIICQPSKLLKRLTGW